jgi:hypothetical protein
MRLIKMDTKAYSFFAGGYRDSSYSNAVYSYAVDEEGTINTKRLPALTVGRYYLAGAAAGNVVFFAGGYASSDISDAVDAYKVENGTVTKLEDVDALSEGRVFLAGASAGNVVFFAGGYDNNYNYSDAVDAYKVDGSTVTKLEDVDALTEARQGLAGASAGNVVFFAGGYNSTHGYITTVEAYKVDGNTVTKLEDFAALSEGREFFAGVTAGNVAFFAGGYNSTHGYITTVDAYKVDGDTVIKLEEIDPLSEGRECLAGASFTDADGNNYAVFSGGSSSAKSYEDAVDVYKVNKDTDEVSKVDPADVPKLLDGFQYGAGASVNGTAIFAGGVWSRYAPSVDAYKVDGEGNVTKLEDVDALSEGRYYLAGASAGNVVFFAGGSTGSSYSNAVDAYKVDGDTVIKLDMTDKELTVAREHLAGASVGNVVFFAGGYRNSYSDAVDAYKVDGNEITKLDMTSIPLTVERDDLLGTAAGNIVFFAGGEGGGGMSAAVDAYKVDEEGNVTKLTGVEDLSEARECLAGASAGNVVFFAGGEGEDGVSIAVDAYEVDEEGNVTKLTGITALSEARWYLAGASAGNVVFFAGGEGEDGVSIAVDAYEVDEEGNVTKLTDVDALSEARWYLAGASAGNVALFAGGEGEDGVSNAVDAYKVNGQIISSRKEIY